MELDNKQTIYFLMNSIDLARGGLTRASLKQASVFAEMGYNVQMITFNMNLKYPEIRKKLVDMEKVHPDVVIRNMYEELEGHNKPLAFKFSRKKPSLKELAEGGTIDKRNGHNGYRIYKNGLYIKYISFRKDDTLHFIDYFNENRYRTKRVEYDLSGIIRKVSFMDFQVNKPRQIIHYDTSGNAYYSQWNNPSKENVKRINLFNPKNGEIEQTFFNPVDLKTSWLEKIISGSHNPLVISDTRSTDKVLAELDKTVATKIWRLHSSHVKYPFELYGDIAGKVKTGIDNLDKFDGAFVLTQEQKDDLVKRFGGESFFQVVPHYHEEKKQNIIKKMIKQDKKDDKLAVIVSRLSTLKRVDHSIRAFRQVIEQVPDAKLEIWGNGQEKEKLVSLIEELDLKNHVFLKGYTHEPDRVYKKGLFSLLTSKSEGFALSILESMVNKTPVISYNIKYGPNEMIQSNKTGLLVEDKDVSGLADSMIHLFNNPEKAHQMGEAGATFIEQTFSKEAYKQQWEKAIENVQTNKQV